jgi:hypothetical protein
MESGLPVFSIGRAPKKNKYAKNIKKKVAKELKGIKSIKNKKTKAKIQITIFTVKFKPYTGRRMFLPDAVPVSKDIQTMFNQIMSHAVLNPIEESIAIEGIQLSFFTIFTKKRIVKKGCAPLEPTKWNAPISVQNYINNGINTQVLRWIKVREYLTKMPFVFTKVNRFIRYWRAKRCMRNAKNTEDIATMEVPTQPVYIIDYANHCSYVFQALTIKKAMENRLLQSDWMFVDAAEPVNPFTNISLTRCQLYSVISQLQRYYHFSWILDRYKSTGFSIAYFTLYYQQMLKIEAIKNHFINEKDLANETVIDFFNNYADDVDFPLDRRMRVYNLIRTNPDNSLTKQWYSLAREYYISEQLNDPTRMAILACAITSLLNNSYLLTV